jgi:type IV pilus assembly protein PilP
VRAAIAILATTLVLWGCGPETTGTSVADYEAQRAATAGRQKVAPRGVAKQGGAATGAQKGAAGEDRSFGSTNSGFTYEREGKRDPFRSFVLEFAKDRRLERGPLEQFDLTQISLVAVVWDTTKPRALVQDPSGRAYVVSEGTHIGKNDGRVISIGDNKVVVKETYEDYLGERTEKDIEMHVRQNQGG